jgi:hypothetical protein
VFELFFYLRRAVTSLLSSHFYCETLLRCCHIDITAGAGVEETQVKSKSKAVPLDAMVALGGSGDIALTHSRPRR